MPTNGGIIGPENIPTTAVCNSTMDFRTSGAGGHLDIANSGLNGGSLTGRTTYTLEAWVYPTSLPTSGTGNQSGLWGSGGQDLKGTSVEMHSGNNTYVYHRVSNAAGNDWLDYGHTGDASPSVNNWHHFAEVQHDGTNKLYMNGTHINTETTDSVGHGTYLSLPTGAEDGSGSNPRNAICLVSVWRVSSNARYTANFVPPTEFIDDDYTLFLVVSDTTDGSTSFKDSSSNNETVSLTGGPADHSTDVASNISVLKKASGMWSMNDVYEYKLDKRWPSIRA